MNSKFVLVAFVLSCCLLGQHANAQMSPWGTGMINNQLIGNLVDNSVVFPSNSGYGNNGYYPDPNTLLPTYTYDIYIPPSYDGTEPYGLVTFINSGNNGSLFTQWQSVLDEKKLIYIAGDNIGNSINVNIRMGVAMAAVYRLKEVLNIDSTRIYTSGNSGGARMASVLAYTYPEWFFGSMPNCGSSYPRQVAQDYETQNPNSHYEYTIPFTTADLNYIKSFDRRYGILTSFDDFREGDIMNIYHNGMVPDGFKGKFLETAGPHCATTTEHFRDAVNFVEHPHIPLIEDDFSSPTPTTGDGFTLHNATINNDALSLNHSMTATAQAYSNNPFLWDDEKGSIFTTSVSCDTATYNNNSHFHLGLWSFQDSTIFCDSLGLASMTGLPSILLTIAYDAAQPTLFVVINNPTQNIDSDTIFQATFDDWMLSDSLDIKYHIWDKELRIELGRHFVTPTISSTAAKMLDDRRSIRIRWNDFGLTAPFWNPTAWDQGTLLTFASENISGAGTNTTFHIHHANIWTAETNNINNIPAQQINISANNDTLVAPNGFDAYQWYLDGVAINGATMASYQAMQSGDYTVSVYTGSNCELLSNSISITLLNNHTIFNRQNISIYPNPNNGSFTIQNNGKTLEISIFNTLGQVVYQETTTGITPLPIQLDRTQKGLFLVKVKDLTLQQEIIHKVIIE